MRTYYMAQYKRPGEAVRLIFCETESEAREVVRAGKAAGYQASYWEL